MDMERLRALVRYFDLQHFLINNPPMRLAVLLLIMVIMAILAHFICNFARKKIMEIVEKKLEGKTAHTVSTLPAIDIDMFNNVVKKARNFLYVLILGWGLERLNIEAQTANAISIIFTAIYTIFGIRLLASFVPFQMDMYCRHHGTTLRTSQTRSLMPIISGVIWAIGLTFLLDNLGLHVSTIIAGLGIVGVAVGLAGQAILADFFSYIVILLDKPFLIGDFVILANGKSGEVEYLGPKNTRLRSLDDDVIVCANSELTKNILVNQGSIREREVIVEIGVAFTVPMETVKKVPQVLQEVVESFPQCVFKRAAMLNFGTANYLFQLIYKVKSRPGGLEDFINTQSQVNLAFTDRMNREGMVGAYPTESILFTDVTPKK